MSESVMIDINLIRFSPFIYGLSRDEYKDKLMENGRFTPEIIEKELSIYDYIDEGYSNLLKQAREKGVLFELVIDICEFFKGLNIVLGETDEGTIMLISKRLDRIEKEEENRIKNEKLRKKQKKMKRKLKAKNRQK